MNMMRDGEEKNNTGESTMKYAKKLMGERTTMDGIVICAVCGMVILFGGLAKMIAWAGLAYGAYTLFKTEK